MNASVAEGVDEDKSKRTRKKSTSIITKEEGGGEALEPLPPKPPMTNRETFSANILTAGFWPSAAKLDVVLPPELQSLRDDFESYYLEQYTGRRLGWQHSTSTCVLKVKFASGTKELAVSLAQAVIILAFNEDDDDTNDDEQQQQHKQFTYKELKEKTNIPDVELKRTLQSLYGGNSSVIKNPDE